MCLTGENHGPEFWVRFNLPEKLLTLETNSGHEAEANCFKILGYGRKSAPNLAPLKIMMYTYIFYERKNKMSNKILCQLHLKKPAAILNNDMKSHDKISYICRSKYATLRVLKDHY